MEKHILILTHGEFGISLLQSAKMIIGNLEDVSAIPLLPEDSGDTFYQKVAEVLDGISKEVICLVDLFGGSPCNTALRISKDRKLEIVCGLNLPMFIELYSQVSSTGSYNTKALVEVTRSNIFDVVEKFSHTENA